MKKFLKKIKNDCKGAVTVIVTLLLIPAVLISGTGVDMARIYAAKSILHDGNQLAANSALASYDALLQDLYGLYGMMTTDPEFADMMDKYIKVALFPEGASKELGTFQLFYGSNLASGTLSPVDGQNLANTEVLRRQIEEYAKFRAPAIIVTEILDRLDTYKNIQADADVIKDKMDIEDGLEDLEEIYRDIYNKINDINYYPTFEYTMFNEINSAIENIEYEFDEMYNTRDSYHRASDNGDDEEAEEYRQKYLVHIENIRAFINGGEVKSGYYPGGYDENGDYKEGYWKSVDEIRSSEGMKSRLDVYESTLDEYKSKLDKLVNAGEKADQKKAELKQKIQELRNKLDSGDCSEELKTGLKPKLAEYENLIQYDVKPMCEAMKKHDMPLFDKTRDIIMEAGYGDDSQGTTGTLRFISFYNLGTISENGNYPIDEGKNFGPPDVRPLDRLYEITSVNVRRYSRVSEIPFKAFQHQDFNPTHNSEFYNQLKKLFEGTESQNKETAEKNINDALKKIQEYFTGLLEFNPEGAWKYTPGTQTEGEESWTSGNWGDKGVARDKVKDAMGDDLLTQLGKGLGEAANAILLLTYDCEMFSCYTTNKREDHKNEVSMSGIPLGIDVNYFYQSELEYLFHGDEQSAQANLAVITGMIFLVRFVLDYVASFSISQVNAIVDSVKAACAGLGPFAVLIGELVRLAMALGEAVVDTSRLKFGDFVAIYKTDDTWKFQINLESITGSMGDLVFSDSESKNDDDSYGMYYKDYMRLFLLLSNKDDLAYRTSRLIAFNVTNKREGIGGKGSREARESAMSSAQLFDMSKALTGFSLTTTVDLEMLFLGLPYAQEGVDGRVPPGQLALSATDYRGY